MSHFSYEERKQVYEAALGKWGQKMQSIVAIEEMSEVIKEITKTMRGELNRAHLAEEIADATIMLEQLRNMFDINDSVESWVDYKIAALQRKVRK